MVWLCCAILGFTPAAAREVRLTGVGTVRAHADHAIVAFRHKAMSEADAASALGACRQTVERARAALRRAGIRERDVQEIELRVWTQTREPRDAPPQVVGFIAEQRFQVVVRELSARADLIQAVLDAGVLEVQHTTWRTSEADALRLQARQLALVHLREQASFIEDTLGRELQLEMVDPADVSFQTETWQEGARSSSRAGVQAAQGGGPGARSEPGIPVPPRGAPGAALIRVGARVEGTFVVGE